MEGEELWTIYVTVFGLVLVVSVLIYSVSARISEKKNEKFEKRDH